MQGLRRPELLNKHCIARKDSTLEREVRVPAHWDWDDQVRYASGQRRAAEALRRPAHVVHAPPVPDARASSCGYYAQALRDNDSAQRAGGTARWMEHLAQQRRQLIVGQSGAGCR